MFLTEYNQEMVLEKQKQETESEVRRKIASEMLRQGESISKVVQYSNLPEPVVHSLANAIQGIEK